MMGAFNVKTRVTDGLTGGGGEAKLVAEGVWVVQGQPGRCNVYLLEKAANEGGVTMFDAGARTMTRAVARAGARLGGITQIVLGHGHTDHRGTAPGLGVPRAVPSRGGPGRRGQRRLALLAGRPRRAAAASAPDPPRAAPLRLGRRPGEDRGTVKEGDEIAGFKVIDLPGHAPGLIGLWRESDRLALVSDCFYTIDMWGRNCAPQRAGADLQLRHRAGARRACASSPRWSPRRPGRAMHTRSRGMCGDSC